MLNLPPIYPVADMAFEERLSDQIRRLGESGFPVVGYEAGAAEEELGLARSVSWENGGWPAIEIPDHQGPSLSGLSLEEAVRHFQAGAQSIFMGRELLGASDPAELLWQAQCLRWRFRPPFRGGKGIALIGGSGCGKSTLARELGDRLHLPVRDLDDVIAQRMGKPIPAIFAEDGEGAFRAMEAEVTCEAFQSPAVLALGGGAWESEGIRLCARTSGYSVLWIAENPGRIWQRVAQDPGRPLAQERTAFLARWRARVTRWTEAPMVLPLGRTPGQLAEALLMCPQ